MYWEGGALLLTLSGQPCSRTTRSHITFAVSGRRPAVHPIPDHSSDVAGGPGVRGWRRNPAGGSSAVPRGPIQTWKHQLLGQDCSGDGGLPCAGLSCWHEAEGHGGAVCSETETDTCSDLFSPLLVPPNEMFKCLFLRRLGLTASSC